MISRFSFFVGYRYWRARKANTFASFITVFAVTGIVLGVAALIVVSSVMNGLESQLKQRILGAVPQLTLSQSPSIQDWKTVSRNLSALPNVLGASPSVTTQAMLQSSANIGAAQVYGVYPELESQLSQVAKHTYAGDFNHLQPGKYNIILGAQLARNLGVAPGDKIRVLSGDGVVYTPLGPVPSQRKFRVIALFEMGSMVDASLAYVHYQDAKRLMRQPAHSVEQLRLYLDDPFAAIGMGETLAAEVGLDPVSTQTSDWRKSYGHLFAAVKMEKNMMSLMLSLIVAVAAFNIVSALVMMVVDKTTDVAVLKTQGLDTRGVMGIFIIQGTLNAVIGLALGMGIGVLLTLNLNTITQVLGVSILGAGQSLPIQLQISQLAMISIGTLVISLVATIYPALKAAKVQPANALRYE